MKVKCPHPVHVVGWLYTGTSYPVVVEKWKMCPECGGTGEKEVKNGNEFDGRN